MNYYDYDDAPVSCVSINITFDEYLERVDNIIDELRNEIIMVGPESVWVFLSRLNKSTSILDASCRYRYLHDICIGAKNIKMQFYDKLTKATDKKCVSIKSMKLATDTQSPGLVKIKLSAATKSKQSKPVKVKPANSISRKAIQCAFPAIRSVDCWIKANHIDRLGHGLYNRQQVEEIFKQMSDETAYIGFSDLHEIKLDIPEVRTELRKIKPAFYDVCCRPKWSVDDTCDLAFMNLVPEEYRDTYKCIYEICVLYWISRDALWNKALMHINEAYGRQYLSKNVKFVDPFCVEQICKILNN